MGEIASDPTSVSEASGVGECQTKLLCHKKSKEENERLHGQARHVTTFAARSLFSTFCLNAINVRSETSEIMILKRPRCNSGAKQNRTSFCGKEKEERETFFEAKLSWRFRSRSCRLVVTFKTEASSCISKSKSIFHGRERRREREKREKMIKIGKRERKK